MKLNVFILALILDLARGNIHFPEGYSGFFQDCNVHVVQHQIAADFRGLHDVVIENQPATTSVWRYRNTDGGTFGCSRRGSGAENFDLYFSNKSSSSLLSRNIRSGPVVIIYIDPKDCEIWSVANPRRSKNKGFKELQPSMPNWYFVHFLTETKRTRTQLATDIFLYVKGMWTRPAYESQLRSTPTVIKFEFAASSWSGQSNDVIVKQVYYVLLTSLRSLMLLNISKLVHGQARYELRLVDADRLVSGDIFRSHFVIHLSPGMLTDSTYTIMTHFFPNSSFQKEYPSDFGGDFFISLNFREVYHGSFELVAIPTASDQYYIACGIPIKPTSFHSSMYHTGFDRGSWLCLIGFVALSGILADKILSGTRARVDRFERLTFVVSIFMARNTGVPDTIKLIGLPWLLTAVVLLIGYEGNTVTTMTKPRQGLAPTTNNELMLYGYGTISNTFNNVMSYITSCSKYAYVDDLKSVVNAYQELAKNISYKRMHDTIVSNYLEYARDSHWLQMEVGTIPMSAGSLQSRKYDIQQAGLLEDWAGESEQRVISRLNKLAREHKQVRPIVLNGDSLAIFILHGYLFIAVGCLFTIECLPKLSNFAWTYVIQFAHRVYVQIERCSSKNNVVLLVKTNDKVVVKKGPARRRKCLL